MNIPPPRFRSAAVCLMVASILWAGPGCCRGAAGGILASSSSDGKLEFTPPALGPLIAQSITWVSPSGGILDLGVAYPLNATSSSGGPVSFRVESGPGLIADGALTVTNLGSVSVTAEQSGTETHGPAALTRTFNLSTLRFDKVTSWPGYQRRPATGVALAGQYAYVAAGALQIFDVSEPAATFLAAAYGSSSILNVRVVPPYAYVIKEFAGLDILDISDPKVPVRVSSLNVTTATDLLEVSGDRVYIAAPGGLRMIDVSDRTRPAAALGTIPAGPQCWGAHVLGDRAYVAADTAGLVLVDLSDPAGPRVTAALRLGARARDVRVSGGVAYVAAESAGLIVVDVSQPAGPIEIGRLKTPGLASRITLKGDQVYVADDFAGVQVIDVTDPSRPSRVGGYNTSGSAFAVEVSGNIAFVADNQAGFAVLDMSDLARPVQVSAHGTVGMPQDVRVAGRFAYVADYYLGVQILDVLDLEHPIAVGTFPTTGAARSLRLSGSLAYVAANSVEILDISNAPRLNRLGRYSARAESLALAGNLVYMANGSLGMEVVDVTEPSDPRYVGGFNTGVAYGVDVVGKYAYVAAGSSFQILDVSDPARPLRVARWTPPGVGIYPSDLRDVKVAGDRAFLTERSSGLLVVDVADPSTPVLVAPATLGGMSGHVQLAGNVLAAAGWQLLLFDVSDPLRLTRLGVLNFQSPPVGFDVVGDLTYSASSAGLDIYRSRSGVVQDIQFSLPTQATITTNRIPLNAQAESGLPVSFSVVSGPAVISGSDLVLMGAGPVVVRATQAGDSRFHPVAVQRLIDSRLQLQSLNWSGPAHSTLNINQPYALEAIANSGLPVNARVASGPGQIVGSDLIVTNMGAVAVVAEQGGNAQFAPVALTRTFNAGQVTLTPIGQWPGFSSGPIAAVQSSGKHLYAAMGSAGLAVYDASVTNQRPPRIGGLNLGRSITALGLAGSRLYLLDGSYGFHIVDVTDPAGPAKLGSCVLSALGIRFDVAGNFAWVASGAGGLQVVEVTNPADPRVLARHSFVGAINDVSIQGDVAFLAAGDDGLVTLNIQDRLQPWKMASFVPGYAWRVAVAGQYACVGTDTGAYIVNVADPGRPVFVAKATSMSARYIALEGNVLLIADESSVTHFDFTDPSKPLVASITGFGSPIRDLYIHGNRAYVVRQGGLSTLALDSPSGLPQVLSPAAEEYLADFQLAGNSVYLASGSAGLRVIDVSRPEAPVQSGAWLQRTDRVHIAAEWGCFAEDQIALQFSRIIGPGVFNIQGSLETTALIRDMVASSNTLFVAAGNAGVQVIDAADLSQPKYVARYDTPGFASAVQVKDGLVYVADSSAGLQILKEATRTNLTFVGNLATITPVNDLDLAGEFAYLACGTNGLAVVDIADPTRPTLTSKLRTGGNARGVTVVGQAAWLADGTNGVRVIDIGDPWNLAEIGRVDIQATAEDVQVRSNLVFIASSEAGLHIAQASAVRRPQYIDFQLPAQVNLAAARLDLAATSTSILPITFSIVEGPAQIAANQLILNGAGRVVVRAEQTGDDNYLPAVLDRAINVIASDLPTTVRAWIEQSYPQIFSDSRGPTDDPDGDGAPNAIEYVLMTNPSLAQELDGRLPAGRVTAKSGELFFQITFDVNPLSSSSDWSLEETQLSPADVWQPLPTSMIQRSGQQVSVLLPINKQARFVRLRVHTD